MTTYPAYPFGVWSLHMKGASMPYKSTGELPESVRDHLPKHAQEIYMEAFNSAWDQYDRPEERRGGADREETAHKIAWNAVKKGYQKDEKTGRWKSKSNKD
jgi:cation transport regulator